VRGLEAFRLLGVALKLQLNMKFARCCTIAAVAGGNGGLIED
jgi:uncharacterized membrane protein YeiH